MRDVAAAQVDSAHLRESTIYDDAPVAPKPPPPAHPADAVRDTQTSAGMDIMALLGASAQAEAPAPIPAPVPAAPTDTTDTADTPEPDVNRDVAMRDADERAEAVTDKVQTRATAMACVRTLLLLQLELGDPWSDPSEKSARSDTAQTKGAAWATSLRVHCNGTSGHYYSHVAFAHLKEIVEEHGNMQHGNDEVLEKGNRNMKRFRDMTYWGGDKLRARLSRRTVDPVPLGERGV